MPYRSRAPHPALREYVHDYVGYLETLHPRAVHHGLPSCGITMILALDDPLDCGWLDRPDSARRWVSLSGLHLHPALVRPHGRQHGIQLTLTPAGCRALLGVPAAALAGLLTEGTVVQPRLAEVHARVADAPTWADRFDRLDAALLALLRREAAAMTPDLAEVWRRLGQPDGPTRVPALARAVHRSERWLSGRFASEFGITVHQASRLNRFQRSLTAARSGVPLAEVAARSGYADQPHLCREWRTFGGMTPTELLSGPYRILQDGSAEAAAG